MREDEGVGTVCVLVCICNIVLYIMHNIHWLLARIENQELAAS